MRYATFSILFFCDFSYYIHKKVNFLLFAEYGWTDPYCAGFQGAGEFVGLRRAVDSGSNKNLMLIQLSGGLFTGHISVLKESSGTKAGNSGLGMNSFTFFIDDNLSYKRSNQSLFMPLRSFPGFILENIFDTGP